MIRLLRDALLRLIGNGEQMSTGLARERARFFAGWRYVRDVEAQSSFAPTNKIWMLIDPNVQIGVDMNEALWMGVTEFADLYQGCVPGATRHEAVEWGRAQVERRAALRDK